MQCVSHLTSGAQSVLRGRFLLLPCILCHLSSSKLQWASTGTYFPCRCPLQLSLGDPRGDLKTDGHVQSPLMRRLSSLTGAETLLRGSQMSGVFTLSLRANPAATPGTLLSITCICFRCFYLFILTGQSLWPLWEHRIEGVSSDFTMAPGLEVPILIISSSSSFVKLPQSAACWRSGTDNIRRRAWAKKTLKI